MTKVIKGVNDLLTKYPEVAAEWHPTRNGEYKPSDVGHGSSKKVWWQCKKGHEWEAMISNRARLGRGCPICANQLIIPGINDLETLYPDIAKEWHPTKNKNLNKKPSEIAPGTHKKVWWMCSKGHEWEAEVKSRVAGVACPVCANKVVLKGYNDLATILPDVAKEWHPTRNGDKTPEEFTFGSGKKFWWLCKNGHEYRSTIDNRRAGKGCSVCARRRRTSFPEQAVFFYVSKSFPDAINSYKDCFENAMELDVYIPTLRVGIEYDGKRFHDGNKRIKDQEKFNICNEQGIKLYRIAEKLDRGNLLINAHWKVEIYDASPMCLNHAISKLLYKLGKPTDVDVERDRNEILNMVEAGDVSLQSARPDLAAEWHPDKNYPLTPNKVHPGTNDRFWWKCKVCNHEWQTSVAERTKRDQTGCPRCARIEGGKKRAVTNLQRKGGIDKTHPDVLFLWDYEKNVKPPSEVIAHTKEKVCWKCPVCFYRWESRPIYIIRSPHCRKCSGRTVITGVNDLAILYPELMKEWDYAKNTELDPTKLLPGSGKKACWICSKCGYKWQTSIIVRTKGSGCVKCYRERVKKYKNADEHKDVGKEISLFEGL